jgi:hypothetical protein
VFHPPTFGSVVSRPEIGFVGRAAQIFPFDVRVVSQSSVCPLGPLVFFPHDALLSFDTPGTKTILVHGRQYSDEEIEVALSVIVE